MAEYGANSEKPAELLAPGGKLIRSVSIDDGGCRVTLFSIIHGNAPYLTNGWLAPLPEFHRRQGNRLLA
jgi:hypothetical protein